MDKNKLIVAVAVIVLLLLGGFFFLSNRGNKAQQSQNQTQSDVIPTVDASVKVDLSAKDATKHTIVLSIKNMPPQTNAIEYELSYETAQQGLQGVFTPEPVAVKDGRDFTREIVLGTESSGHYVYHQVKGNITLSVKFHGAYGQKLFEKEFPL